MNVYYLLLQTRNQHKFTSGTCTCLWTSYVYYHRGFCRELPLLSFTTDPFVLLLLHVHIRGSPILFSWRVNEHFCFAWNMNEDLFFPWFVNLYIFVLGKLLLDFFVIREICFYFRVIFEATTFAGIIFHFFEDFRVLKARKLHQTRCKTCPFYELADGELRTNHSNNNLEGLESAITYKSLWTNLHFCVIAHMSDANTSSPAWPRPHYIAVGLRQSIMTMDIAPA